MIVCQETLIESSEFSQETFTRTLLLGQEPGIISVLEVLETKKTLPAALMMALLVSTAVGAQFASVARAGIIAEGLGINVLSPFQEQVYYSSDLVLSFSVTKPQSWSEAFPGYSGGILYWWIGFIRFAGYSLDGKESENTTVDDSPGGLTIGPTPSKVFDFSFNLTGLSEGRHNVTASVFGNYKTESFDYSRSVIFFVDTAPLELKIVSPESRLYNITEIPLTVTTTEPVSWIGYRLDEEESVTISENTTLSGLSTGSHNLTILANDTLGNFATSETTTFTITEPEPPASFPTAPIAAASVASIGLAVVGVLVYLRKRKRHALVAP